VTINQNTQRELKSINKICKYKLTYLLLCRLYKLVYNLVVNCNRLIYSVTFNLGNIEWFCTMSTQWIYKLKQVSIAYMYSVNSRNDYKSIYGQQI